MADRKYILTNETMDFLGRKLYKIKAVKDFGNVKKGELGGWVESEDNLSQYGNCWVSDEAKVYDDAWVSGNAKVCDYAKVNGAAYIFGYAEVFDYAEVNGDVRIFDDAKVFDYAKVNGLASIGGDAKIEFNKDYTVFKNTWSSFRHFTWTRSNDMWRVGCFYGSGEELIAKAYKDSELSGKCYEAIVKAQEAISKLNN